MSLLIAAKTNDRRSEAVTEQSSLKIMFCKASQILQEMIFNGATFL